MIALGGNASGEIGSVIKGLIMARLSLESSVVQLDSTSSPLAGDERIGERFKALNEFFLCAFDVAPFGVHSLVPECLHRISVDKASACAARQKADGFLLPALI
jgi:hypothetical protein